jgi:hypothetical protein
MPKMATSDENAAQRNVIEYCVKLKKRPELIDNMENIIFYQDNAPCHRSPEREIEIDVIGFQRLPYALRLCSISLFKITITRSQVRKLQRTPPGNSTLRVLSTLKQDCFENVYDKWVASH